MGRYQFIQSIAIALFQVKVTFTFHRASDFSDRTHLPEWLDARSLFAHCPTLRAGTEWLLPLLKAVQNLVAAATLSRIPSAKLKSYLKYEQPADQKFHMDSMYHNPPGVPIHNLKVELYLFP